MYSLMYMHINRICIYIYNYIHIYIYLLETISLNTQPVQCCLIQGYHHNLGKLLVGKSQS